MALRTS